MRDRKKSLTGISILALSLIVGTLFTPAIAGAETDIRPIDESSITSSSEEAAPEPVVTDSTDSVAFVRDADISDFEEVPDTTTEIPSETEDISLERAPLYEEIPDEMTDSDIAPEEEFIESPSSPTEPTASDVGDIEPLDTNGSENFQSTSDPITTDKIAIILDGNENNSVYELTIDLSETQMVSIPEGFVSFKVRDEDDKDYNIESEITFAFDDSLFMIKPHFDELGADEAIKCLILQSVVDGVVRVLKPLLNLGDNLRPRLIAGIVWGILKYGPLMLYLGLNEFDFNELIQDVSDFIENWDATMDELNDALPAALTLMLLKLYDTFTLETNGNSNEEFLMPGISALLKPTIPDGVYDIDIFAKSGMCNAEHKTIRVTVINGGQQGAQSQEEIVEEQVVLEGTQATSNL